MILTEKPILLTAKPPQTMTKTDTKGATYFVNVTTSTTTRTATETDKGGFALLDKKVSGPTKSIAGTTNAPTVAGTAPLSPHTHKAVTYHEPTVK